jgi:hypothetical protein
MVTMLGVALASCSEGALQPDGGGPSPDGGRCVGDFATLSATCPPMFDGSEANLPACDSRGSLAQSVWRCQDLIALMDSTGFFASTCYYDATSHALVGAEHGSDTTSYCGQTSFSIEAGRTNPMCRENAPTLQRSCAPPDGGSAS